MVNYKRIISLYNIIAELCEFVTGGQAKNYLVRYGCISSLEQERIEYEIEKSTPLRKDEKGKYIPLKDENIDKDFMNSISILAERLMNQNDNNSIMGLIQGLDSSMGLILKEEIADAQQDDFSVELNTNREITGIGLLPRCRCVWARKSRMSYSYRRLDNYLNNFMVMEDRVVDEIMDKHIYLPQGFFRNFDETKKLKVAASPITAKANFDIACHDNDDFKVFEIKYDESVMDEDNRLLWEKILEAGREQADIVVFPEMLGNATTEQFVKQKLSELTDEQREFIPAMIVLPSFSNKGQNSSTILDRNGRRLARQYKQNPFVMTTDEGDYMEDILGYNMINIFHYEGIGRFAVLICKDFLTTRYMERIMRGFMLTMIIVPSYSTGAYDFRTSFDLCAHDYCNVIWINSCAAMTPGKEMNFESIGYIRKRISRYDDESDALFKMKPCSKLFEGKCEKNCMYYDSFGAV